MELIFILTYNCNYRCRYCDIDKRMEDMSREVVEQSLIFLSKHRFEIGKTKFFGGEPTLRFDDIEYIIENFPKNLDSKFYLTTNGSLLDQAKINEMKKYGIITTVSIDGDQASTDENRQMVWWWHSLYSTILAKIAWNESFFRVNQVITPKNVGSMMENFKFLYELWFREFNFLPEYYVEWSKKSLLLLHEWFSQIRELSGKYHIYLVNSENYSPTSFFNFGIVIDTDGSVYGTNLILAGRFEKYKDELRLGSVYDLDFVMLPETEQWKYLKKIDSFLRKEYSQNIMNSVYYVNQILSQFTLLYGKQQ